MSLNIDRKAPSGACVPKTMRELQESLAQTMSAGDSVTSVASDAIVTIGRDRPTENSERQRRVHLKQDANNAITAIEYHALGQWNTFAQVVLGECRYFRPGVAPQGWKPADGTEGTSNVKEESPSVYSPTANESVILHQFMGIL